MSVRIGISPIAWQNDDLPELTAAYSMDQALREAREIGYLGVERGRRMPEGTEELAAYLARYDLALCGGWCSGNLLRNSVAEEREAVAGQVAQFVALSAPYLVYAECSNTVQGQIGTPLSRRPRLDRDQIRAYGAKLSELAKWMADAGLVLAYHHHMGSIIEDREDVNWLMEYTAPEVTLLFDTGHLRFAGADPLAVFRDWSGRVSHVHYKDVRADALEDMRRADASFLQAVMAGAFTVPGDPDGAIDFAPITRALAEEGYDGWIVVEAEQDPAKAPPREYAQMGYDHILHLCAEAGLDVAGR